VTVDIGEVGARRLLHEDGEGSGPLDHPVHRHAVQQRHLCSLVERLGARVALDERGLLPRHQVGEAIPVKAGHGSPMVRVGGTIIGDRPVDRPAVPPPAPAAPGQD